MMRKFLVRTLFSGLLTLACGSEALATAPLFGAAGTNDSQAADSTKSLPSYPTGITAGQMLIVCVVGDDSAVGTESWTTPATWTVIARVADAQRRSQACFWKTAVGNESGTLTVNATTTNGTGTTSGVIYRYTNANAVEAAGAAGPTSNTAAAPASITTTGANELAVAVITTFAAVTVGAITGNSGGTWTKDTGPVGTLDELTEQSAPLAAAGTISGGSATLGSTSNWEVITFAIFTQSATNNGSLGTLGVGN